MSKEQALWGPLRVPVFRNLLAANVVSDVGSFMQSVGAAWLMVSFGAGPLAVALTQTATSLPFFLLALPAGAIGDIVDRRKLILVTESWMAGCTVVLAALTFAGRVSPWGLLVFTFLISAGDAIEAPSWRAVLPELVPPAELAAASALNGIEFNLARAVGPAAAGALIAVAGVGPAFALNAASFAGVILVVARWRRPTVRRTAPAEHLRGATVAALRYVRYSPRIRGTILRAGGVMFFGSSLLALLPSIAHRESGSPLGYGVLVGCFGAGAIGGALLMQRARARWSTETVASAAVVGLGAATLGAAAVRGLPALAALLLVAGGCWIAFISLMSAAVQVEAPDWVRARALAVYLLVFQGAMAAGTALWGAISEHVSIAAALAWAGAGTFAAAALGAVWRLPEGPIDVTPWQHWPTPTLPAGAVTGGSAGSVGSAGSAAKPESLGADDGGGPVLVTVEYFVDPANAAAFVAAMHAFERIRRRDGAASWGIFRDSETADRYLETFLVDTWAEHLRQHTRLTQADRDATARVQALVRGTPAVHHLLYAAPAAENAES